MNNRSVFKTMLSAVLLASSGLVQASTSTELQLLSGDCYQEWLSRGWTLGEDATQAASIARYRESIYQMCEISAELFVQGWPVSPYIPQSQRLVLPFIFSASRADIRSWLIELGQQDAAPAYDLHP